MTFTIAATVDQATAAMAAGAVPIAGGTDLVVGTRQGKQHLPADLVAIDRIPELSGISAIAGLTIGALTTHAALMAGPAVVRDATALADAAALVGSPATRNTGTLGGNIMNASPAMDTGAPLVVLGAQVRLTSPAATRVIPIENLWEGPGVTTSSGDELCVGVELPAPADNSASAYVRLEYRRAMEIAVVGAAAAITLAPDGSVADLRVALSAVAPTVIAVRGLTADGASPADAARLAADAARQTAQPISDLRASDAYRSHCIGVIAGRAVDAAARRATGEVIGVPVNRALGIGAA